MYSYSSSYQKRFSSRWINIHFWCYLNHTVHWSVRIKLKALFVTLKTKKTKGQLNFDYGVSKHFASELVAISINSLPTMQKWFLAWIMPTSCHYFFLPIHFGTLLALTQNTGSTAETSQAWVSVLSLILHRINISILSRDSLMKLQNSTQLAASLTRHPTRNAGSQITLSWKEANRARTTIKSTHLSPLASEIHRRNTSTIQFNCIPLTSPLGRQRRFIKLRHAVPVPSPCKKWEP